MKAWEGKNKQTFLKFQTGLFSREIETTSYNTSKYDIAPER